MNGKMMIQDAFYSMKVPLLRRARGYFLYTADGRRFLDLYQDNGRAILGHRIPGMQRVMKSTVSKGLLAPYPSVYGRRLEKMVEKLFHGDRIVRIYRNRERMLQAAASILGNPVSSVAAADPLLKQEGDLVTWRPFLPGQEETAPLLVPVLPFPGDFAPVILAADNKYTALPPSDTVSPFLSDALVKGISELLVRLSQPPEDDLSLFDFPLWNRRGRYLVFKTSGAEYRAFHGQALSAGIYLPPSPESPGIIPLEYERGHVKKFLTLLKEVHQWQ